MVLVVIVHVCLYLNGRHQWRRHGFSSVCVWGGGVGVIEWGGRSHDLKNTFPKNFVSPRFSATLLWRPKNYAIFHKHLRKKIKNAKFPGGRPPGYKKCGGQDTPDPPSATPLVGKWKWTMEKSDNQDKSG